MTEPVRRQFGGEISLLPLPGIKVWSDDIPGLVRRRRRPVQGPFVLIGRDKGLALDVGAQTGQGYEPQLWPPHARPWQLWYFRQTPHRGEYLIISVASGLALDARRKTERGRHPLMWVPHGDEQQRWRLHPAADGAAFLIECVRTRHVLDVPPDAVTGTKPLMFDRHDGGNQMFLIMMPTGGKPAS